MDKTMKDRLDGIKGRYEEINEELMKPEVASDPKQLMKLGREQAGMRETVSLYDTYLESHDFYVQAKEMLEIGDEPELVELAQEEMAQYQEQIETSIEKLRVLLIPRDPADDHDAIVEIRGAAGGDEGNIFAGDLYRMYSRYAESIGLKIEVLEATESEAGGFTMISFVVKGNDAYRHFKFESGAHRVQRVPKTETQGRIHTSTATVLVMADVDDDEIDIDPNDLVIETHRASGAGGQHVNKTDSAVRITHKPTGISVNCQDGRSQHDNRDKAMRIIRARVFEEHQRERDAAKSQERASKVGRGDRSEKIRTYNYPQNRVSDHRIGLTLQKLDMIMEGRMGEIVDALLEQEQREILEQGL
ncbi:peptide chain release factor 1 [Erysipelothrix larvae]|uniref:Peptide chain release factor 1 n=1 Tax=Erysipelothrix larvae TaxID=1514105 RepID=A0A0X8H255_9FIRM|nr:peptide chain release factor 1 [Erysipelothrix larvae]AMC94676.1 peptide chain release factor 1 [Erysipelothrix larvae]